MSVIAEFTLAPGKLSFATALSAAPSVEFEIEREYGTRSAMPVVFCWARGGDLAAFERGLERDPTVTDVERLSEPGDRRLYRLRLTGAAAVVTYDAWVEQGAARLEMRYADGRWHTRMRFPDRATLSAFSAFCTDHDLDFRLDRLYDADTGREPPRDGLTSCQRETLQLAHDRGYFDVPRSATLGDLADELGVSNQAVSERLRRGCARLVGDLFG